MKNTAGEAKRRGRKAPMSVPFFLESKAKDWQYKKGTLMGALRPRRLASPAVFFIVF